MQIINLHSYDSGIKRLLQGRRIIFLSFVGVVKGMASNDIMTTLIKKNMTCVYTVYTSILFIYLFIFIYCFGNTLQ